MCAAADHHTHPQQRKRRQMTGDSHEGDTIEIKGAPGYGRCPRELLRDPTISPGARLMWTILEDHASAKSPQPFPGQDTLAEYLGCTDRTIRNYRAELEAAGWLEVHKRGFGKSNRHVLRWYPQARSGNSFPDQSGNVVPVNPETEFRSIRKQVSAEAKPVEAEPVKQPSTNGSACPSPLHGVNGNEREGKKKQERPDPEPASPPDPHLAEQTRMTVVAIKTALGLSDAHRGELTELVGPLIADGHKPDTVYAAAAGSMNGVRSSLKVVEHRLARLTT